MERLSTDKRASILRCLIEGSSILSTSRMTGAAKNTIVGLLAAAGEACEHYHDKHMVNLPCKLLQLDELWSFVGCKEKNKDDAIGQHPGDVWTWTSLCAETKLIPSWRVGDRSATTAFAFCHDLGKRFAGHVQVTSDGHNAYRWAVGNGFRSVDFAQLVKVYGTDSSGNQIVTGVRKTPIIGQPDMDLVSTSYVERSNLTIRMTNRRFTRLTNAFSKKLENHRHMLALGFMSYNFCRRHTTIRATPAQAAGVSKDRWSMEQVVEMMDDYWRQKEIDAFEAKFSALRRGPKTYEPQAPRTPRYIWTPTAAGLTRRSGKRESLTLMKSNLRAASQRSFCFMEQDTKSPVVAACPAANLHPAGAQSPSQHPRIPTRSVSLLFGVLDDFLQSIQHPVEGVEYRYLGPGKLPPPLAHRQGFSEIARLPWSGRIE